MTTTSPTETWWRTPLTTKNENGRTFEQVKRLDGIPMRMRCDLFSGEQHELADLEKGIYDTIRQQHALLLFVIM